MRNLGADPIALGQELYEFSSTPRHAPGTRAVMGGREYRYVKAGGVTLVAGNVLQAPAQITNHHDLTPVAAAIGDRQVTVALGGTLAAENQYAGGLLVITTTPGQGYSYPIVSHPAAALSTNLVVTLGQPIQVALTTSSRCQLIPNRYVGVIQTPVTTLTGAGVGVAAAPITADNWGWIQTKGECGTLIAGTPGVGLAVVIPGTAAGAVVVDGAAAATQVVGAMMVTGVDGKILGVNINFP